MNGYYRNNRKIIKFLTDWHQEAIETESWEIMDHFHLDQIGKNFKQPEKWLDMSFEIFLMYYDIIDKSKYTILLQIPLLESTLKTDITLLNSDYIRININDFEPPSIYLDLIGNNDLTQTINRSLPINISDFYDNCFKFYYYEQKDDIDGLYYRSIFVVKK